MVVADNTDQTQLNDLWMQSQNGPEFQDLLNLTNNEFQATQLLREYLSLEQAYNLDFNNYLSSLRRRYNSS